MSDDEAARIRTFELPYININKLGDGLDFTAGQNMAVSAK